MRSIKPSPILLIIIFIGIALLALSQLGFYSEFSYKVEINNKTGEPLLDSSGNLIYNASEEQEIAKEFYDYENKVIEGHNFQTIIIWIFMLFLIAFAIMYAVKPYLFPRKALRGGRRR